MHSHQPITGAFLHTPWPRGGKWAGAKSWLVETPPKSFNFLLDYLDSAWGARAQPATPRTLNLLLNPKWPPGGPGKADMVWKEVQT